MTNNAAILVHVFCCTSLWCISVGCISSRIRESWILHIFNPYIYRLCIYSINAQWSSKVVAPNFISWCREVLVASCYYQNLVIIVFIVGAWWYLIVLIFISLMKNMALSIFICVYWPFEFPLLDSSSSLLPNFPLSFLSFLLICKISLYILGIIPLIHIYICVCLTNVSHAIAYIFSLFQYLCCICNFSAIQIIISFIISFFVLFKKSFPATMIMKIFLMLFSRCSIVLVFTFGTSGVQSTWSWFLCVVWGRGSCFNFSHLTVIFLMTGYLLFMWDKTQYSKDVKYLKFISIFSAIPTKRPADISEEIGSLIPKFIRKCTRLKLIKTSLKGNNV